MDEDWKWILGLLAFVLVGTYWEEILTGAGMFCVLIIFVGFVWAFIGSMFD